MECSLTSPTVPSPLQRATFAERVGLLILRGQRSARVITVDSIQLALQVRSDR